MQKPKISVVIPAYNEERYIAGAIKAILKQDHPSFEIIVVDNNSKDHTYDVASSFIKTDKRIRVVKEFNQGLLHAREKGRLESQGSIIANMDADCRPETNWLSLAEKYLDRPGVVSVTGPYDYYDGNIYFRVVSSLTQRFGYKIFYIIFHNIFGVAVILIGGNNLIKKEALEKMGGYNTKIKFYGEDTDTAKRLLKVGKVRYKLDVEMPTSARRFENKGVINIFAKYIVNFLSVLIFNKPYNN